VGVHLEYDTLIDFCFTFEYIKYLYIVVFISLFSNLLQSLELRRHPLFSLVFDPSTWLKIICGFPELLGLHSPFSFCQGHVAGLRMRVAIQTMLVLKWTLPLTF